MQAFFLELIKLSLIGSLFAGAVMLVRLLFPKTPKWIFCLLWGVVALRLICPVSIESSFSLVPDSIASGQIITGIGDNYIGDVDIIYESDEDYGNAVDAGRQPVYSQGGHYVVTEHGSLEAPRTVGQILYPVLSGIWVAGTVAMLLYTAVSYLMLRRKMAEATRLRENIWQCEQVDSPFVLGLFKPKIYLPYTLSEADMASVIAHEKTHIHRRDHWWKPIGFILLSIHWFNPVLWFAYILLCRDIEAACDEKVIKHMEKDEMRAYSTALLNCSVNRRRIAACPLAFGEVGVKERVKTVMNYKKPAFWLVIAAVALCIVVAVSFLTDPISKNDDFNPQLLEFPGVKWGMSPEEVKDALDITDEQIVDESNASESNASNTCDLSVTDLTVFDTDVSFALFTFKHNPGGECELSRVTVMFPDDTDMVKLKEEVSEIYGPGVGETYDYYIYQHNKRENYTFQPPMTLMLKYMAAKGQEPDGLEDNPYQEALDDPEYMNHLWVTENGSSIIPEEIVAYFKYALDQPINEDQVFLQDDANLRDMLDTWPWVTISMSNRCAATIRRDATGSKTKMSDYYTNNYMDFDASLLVEYLNISKNTDYSTAP